MPDMFEPRKMRFQRKLEEVAAGLYERREATKRPVPEVYGRGRSIVILKAVKTADNG